MNKKYLIIGGGMVTLTVFLFVIFSPSQEIINYPPKNDTIIAFGDSLVLGVGSSDGNDFVSLLSKKINKPILNLGISGETTRQGLLRIGDVISKNPGTVLVLFGGNDYLQKVPKEETFKNLRSIILKLHSSGSVVILLGVRGGILADNFKSDFKNLEKETGVVYVPDVLAGLISNSQYMSDTIHPNNMGYEKIAQKVFNILNKYLQ